MNIAVMYISCVFICVKFIFAVHVQVQLPVLRSLAVMCYKNTAVASEIVKGSFVTYFFSCFQLCLIRLLFLIFIV